MIEGWVAVCKRKTDGAPGLNVPENVDLWQRLDALCQAHQLEFRWLADYTGHQSAKGKSRNAEILIRFREPSPLKKPKGGEPRTKKATPGHLSFRIQHSTFRTRNILHSASASKTWC